ncbi:MAG TPA: 5-deoxy-glucuronate isomerase [Candidatus Methylomirabilis sp.]|nr:5-deoxy-glucuronate isomerase [Candidatus Methylomirabilis sp.]
MPTDALIRPNAQGSREAGVIVSVNSERAGWKYISFEVRSLGAGEKLSSQTEDNETALVILGGQCDVESTVGTWEGLGKRKNVFDGLPSALYLPRRTAYAVRARTALEIATCSARAEQEFPARLVRPEDVEVEIRGGKNVTRQISHVLKPEFPAHRLLIVEVYTPSGNWSSYPPHKHDEHNMPHENKLEEIYYYKISRPEGFAIQRLYTGDGRTDEALIVRDNDLVLVREGYHPVVAGPGYHCYYLNVLAGDVRSMQAADDPQYAWIRETWAPRDTTSPLHKLIGGKG